jgi:hypothetical protein
LVNARARISPQELMRKISLRTSDTC